MQDLFVLHFLIFSRIIWKGGSGIAIINDLWLIEHQSDMTEQLNNLDSGILVWSMLQMKKCRGVQQQVFFLPVYW